MTIAELMHELRRAAREHPLGERAELFNHSETGDLVTYLYPSKGDYLVVMGFEPEKGE
jgi:hypothetical protein